MENATFKISTLGLTFLDSTGTAQALQGSAKMDLRVSRPPDAHEPQRLMFTLLESGETERDNVVYWKTKRKINDDLQCN